MSDLLKLAERVEALEGPDREVDGLIARQLWPNLDWHELSGVWCSRDASDATAFSSPPEFTASFEAAMAIVPEGMFEQVAAGSGTKAAFAQLVHFPEPSIFRVQRARRRPSIYVRASTPALALCAAALRAQGSQQG